MKKWKIGDEIVYKGTKEGRTDDDWKTYFGRYGVKKGSKGKITHIEDSDFGSSHYFIKDDIREDHSGYLIEEDFEPAIINWEDELK